MTRHFTGRRSGRSSLAALAGGPGHSSHAASARPSRRRRPAAARHVDRRARRSSPAPVPTIHLDWRWPRTAVGSSSPPPRLGWSTLWLHDLRTGATPALPGTDRGAAPFWSPDGSRVGFFAGGQPARPRSGAGHVSRSGRRRNAARRRLEHRRRHRLAPPPTAALIEPARSMGRARAVHDAGRGAGDIAHRGRRSWTMAGTSCSSVDRADPGATGLYLVAALDGALESRRRLIAADAQAIVAGSIAARYVNDRRVDRAALDAATPQLAGARQPVGLRVGRGPLGAALRHRGGDVLDLRRAGHRRCASCAGCRATAARSGTVGEPADTWDLRLAPGRASRRDHRSRPQLRHAGCVRPRGLAAGAGTRISLSTDVR